MPGGSASYEPDNLLDRLTPPERLERHYRYVEARERSLLAGQLPLRGGRVLAVGSGWHPGRHLFPRPEFELLAVDPVPERVDHVLAAGTADRGIVGYAGRLELPAGSFDVVLYREVLHHLAFQGPLAPILAEAHRLLVPGGALVMIEPNLWHPVGLGLQLANRLRLGPLVHGTPDDIPLSPRRLLAELRTAGFAPRVSAVTYAWRRLPPRVHARLIRLDRFATSRLGSRLGHASMIVAWRLDPPA